MKKLIYALAVLVVSVLPALAQSFGPQSPRIYGPADAPYGYVQFCQRSAENCPPVNVQASTERFNPSAQQLAYLDAVNRIINNGLKPELDSVIYGMQEYWTLPKPDDLRADCEDYALLKQKVLIAMGWPRSALLLTVVRDEKNEGHAVLTARTAQGDFILDNKTDEVKLWNQTGYPMVSRQSYLEPSFWVNLEAPPLTSPLAWRPVTVTGAD